MVLSVLLLLLLLGPAKITSAGATATSWVVVVNADSADSLTIANHYCHLRSIPSSNVIFLRDIPDRQQITVEQFRDKIMRPLLQELEQRQLLGHIQGVAYSAGFPTAIDLKADLASLEERPKFLTPIGSLTGLTYLYRYVMASSPQVIGLESNFYARGPAERYVAQPPSPAVAAQWQQMLDLGRDGQHQAAAELAQQLLERLPEQFPLAYYAARQWSQAGKPDQALDSLQQAIDRGWSFRQHMWEDPAFTTLKDQARFQVLRDLCSDLPFDHQPTVGFEARNFWAANGIGSPRADSGVSYLLSMMLGCTAPAGNTVEEVIAALDYAASADQTHPEGTFYFTLTGDVRTTTRSPAFEMAIEHLKRLGRRGEIVKASLPRDKDACLGVMIGSPNYDWGNSGSQLMPGAIAESLTSFGGHMSQVGGQTKLSYFLRYGAAASSGTVTEPYSIQAKFPHPMMHVHYAEGSTLAEAFYQAVTGPYQLLIVGDPLCQPFTHPPKLVIEGRPSEQPRLEPVRLRMTPDRSSSDTPPPVAMLILVNGRPIQASAFQERLQISIDQLPPGYYELGVVVVGNAAAGPRLEETIPVVVGRADQQLRLELLELMAEASEPEQPRLRVAVRAPADIGVVELLHLGRVIAQQPGSAVEFEVPLAELGSGPVRLQAVGRTDAADPARRLSPPMIVTLP